MTAKVEETIENAAPAAGGDWRTAVRTACARIPPLWPLKNFVAVNPFLGLSDRHFLDAAALIRRVGHGDLLMPADYYLGQIAGGGIDERAFDAAIRRARATLPPGWAELIEYDNLAALAAALRPAPAERAGARVLTFADFLDASTGAAWQNFIVEEISKWCSAYYDAGQTSWKMPWRAAGLYDAWRAAAQWDANPGLMGLKKFCAAVRGLPDDPWQALAAGLNQLGVPAAAQTDFLHRQLMSVSGWAGHVQYRVREHGQAGRTDDSLAHLLAIRLVFDTILFEQFARDESLRQGWRQQVARSAAGAAERPADLLASYVAQLCLEAAARQTLLARLPPGRLPAPKRAPRKQLQAVFCIDVRSEIFRRALEAQSEHIETLGFAGFFGLPVEYVRLGEERGQAQCPVLLRPQFVVRERLADERTTNEAELLRHRRFCDDLVAAWNSFKTSAISCFSFVEAMGLGCSVKLAGDTLALAESGRSFGLSSAAGSFRPQTNCADGCAGQAHSGRASGIPLTEQLKLAAGALKNLGLTGGFAKYVLFCGHGAATVNNPYGSSLDCGACGGHSGEVNARIAADIFNNHFVRAGLRGLGIEIPEDTRFLAGLHNTTTDEVVVFDDEGGAWARRRGPAQIKNWLAAAGRAARRERAGALGLGRAADNTVDRRIFKRSRDWSEVRPEWGLAGNLALIAAPRERTQGVNLGGRVFLHNYRAEHDPDRSVLTLIMTAPMVVASWINLQYYASTVAPGLFGAGNKVIHNVVGTLGVWQGNGGDLQSGLPLQSLHDGVRWRHEPLRLQVILESSRDAINAVLQAQAGVRELAEHGWVNLIALEPESGECWLYVRDLRWEIIGKKLPF